VANRNPDLKKRHGVLPFSVEKNPNLLTEFDRRAGHSRTFGFLGSAFLKSEQDRHEADEDLSLTISPLPTKRESLYEQ
jgi:hypothetical protein